MNQAMVDSLVVYGNIAVKLAVGLTAFILLLRTTNRGQLTQMTPVDLIGNFVLGGIIGGVIYNPDIHIIKFIIVLALWEILVISVNLLRMHTESGRKMIVGSPTPLVIKGEYLQDKFQQAGLDIGDFATLARMQGIHSLHDIWNAQLEPNGQVTIQKKDEPKRATILVSNGVIDEKAMELIEKDEAWLKKELNKNGCDSCKDIFFAEWNEDTDAEGKKSGNLYIITCEKKEGK